jgi:succinate dehydrogenase / fumarate reductase iron-sulfur subunit
MRFTLRVWRQRDGKTLGNFARYTVEDIAPSLSFLEMLDRLNEDLVSRGEEPVAFDHDCREGICGMCALTIDGVPHGGAGRLTACQLHMFRFKDGATITIEPFRARPFPILRDLAVDRSALERIQQAGGYISVRPGQAPDANAIPISHDDAERAMDAAMCIGCGACVAACPNGSAMLFTAAKAAHLNLVPQGAIEKNKRTLAMVLAMDEAGFGNCSNHGECEAVCPKGISLGMIAKLNRDYARAAVKHILGDHSAHDAEDAG